ncbi:DUF3060 domain-containing protein [Mycobacterium marseillense]|uniref:DUF3060 domain-containing protein n=1 Tax=Mycobacterium marseillense TaxID=701042 RepID=UPI0011A93F18|nr:DUF3060 domain-containing protein [Mycobacterium marseillense]
MAANDDPEERIRELERPLAESAWASEQGSAVSAGRDQPPTAPGAPPPWTFGGPIPGPPPRRPSGNRAWWILGTVIAVGVVALAGGIAAFAAHQISGVKSFITSPPSVSTGPAPPTSRRTSPSTSPAPPRGARLSVAGVNENRTIACNENIVSVSGVSNTVTITGHCASLSVSGVQNAVSIEAVEAITASGFNNKVTYHSGAPKISNSGDSNVVAPG